MRSPFGSHLAAAADASGRAHKAVILLWMSGGPSQMETLDPKPGHRNGGPTRSIATAVPGIELAENLPGLAGVMDRVAIIRSMQTREGDHGRATQLLTTGHPVTGIADVPHLGSVMAERLESPSCPLPPFASVTPVDFGRSGSGYLGPRYSPLVISGDNASASGRAGLTIEHLHHPDGDAVAERRYAMLNSIGGLSHSAAASVRAYQTNRDAAVAMVRSGGGGAFDLDDEATALRDAYGRNPFGQGCLLARRLVQRGVACVEVTLSAAAAGSWDSHTNNFATVSSLCETLDPAWSTLITDLTDRDMLDDTLVLWMGEFGRTPRINANGGRDHFPDAWSVAMAGGRVRGGQVIGRTSADGMRVTDRPVTAQSLMATSLAAIGIDPRDENESEERPRPLTPAGTEVIDEVMTG